jgi:hypothetical protein
MAAAKTKKRKGSASGKKKGSASNGRKSTLNTNSAQRKVNVHKADECTICGEDDGGLFSVVLDGDTVKRVKPRENRTLYCKKHADRKVVVRQRRYDNRENGSAPKTKKKGKAKAKATPKKKTTSKKGSKKATAKRRRSSKAQPF